MATRVRSALLALIAVVPCCSHAAKNYTHPETGFTLQQGDLYLYPDFLSPVETSRCVRLCVCVLTHALIASVCLDARVQLCLSLLDFAAGP
jgi:hypothetical protein